MKLLLMFSLFSELLSEYALKCLKSSLVDIRRLLNCLDRLLVDSRKSISRESTVSSFSGKFNSLRRLRLLLLLFNRPLNWSHLFERSLLCCAIRVILISHWSLVWWRSLGQLLLFLLGDYWLISRRWSTEVNRLIDIVAYCSATSCKFTGLPVLQVAW